MARPSKLTPDQWRIIGERLTAGESSSALGREFGIAESTIRGKYPRVTAELTKGLAAELASVETRIATLSPQLQVHVRSAADSLRRTHDHLSYAAEIGADNSRRLQALASRALDHAESEAESGGDMIPHIETVGVAVKAAEIASNPALKVLALNKDQQSGERRSLADLVAAATGGA